MRLEHARLGGRLYTTPRWLDEFGQRLAAADVAHFELNDEARCGDCEPTGRILGDSGRSTPAGISQVERDRVREALEQEGL